jgi:hypothetical protein
VAGCSDSSGRFPGDTGVKRATATAPNRLDDASAKTRVGQWIWSVDDSAVFEESARSVPDLVPTVWIGTIQGARNGRVQSQLALSPRIAGRPSAAVIVRFEDSFTSVWGRADSAIATTVGAALRTMVSAATATGVQIVEVQLDYDCPERLLPRWSAVVARLSRDPLAARSVWVTSLVAHVRRPEYSDLFRARVAGHILQVFDTGDRMTPSYARTIERLASRQRMPFRLGVAAFERQLASGRVTDHRAWFAAARVMGESEWYRGLWVFPGGERWVPLLQPRE